MNFLKKRWAAFLIAFLIITLTSLYSAHRSLGDACQQITDSFFVGVYDPALNMTRPSVDAQLTKRYQSANGLLTLISSYDELEKETEALRDAKNSLHDALSIPDKYRANEKLDETFMAAKIRIDNLKLNDREQAMLEQYLRDFSGAGGIIERAGYNESVREFYRSTLSPFPTNIISVIVSSKLPVFFE